MYAAKSPLYAVSLEKKLTEIPDRTYTCHDAKSNIQNTRRGTNSWAWSST